MHFKKLISILIFQVFLIPVTLAQPTKFISYQEKGNGTPLVLIHAFPTGKHLWDPQLNALSARFHVITLDLWGFGESASTDGDTVGMDKYADEVKQLLDQLHIQKAIIGGESMGGYVALEVLKNILLL